MHTTRVTTFNGHTCVVGNVSVGARGLQLGSCLASRKTGLQLRASYRHVRDTRRCARSPDQRYGSWCRRTPIVQCGECRGDSGLCPSAWSLSWRRDLMEKRGRMGTIRKRPKLLEVRRGRPGRSHTAARQTREPEIRHWIAGMSSAVPVDQTASGIAKRAPVGLVTKMTEGVFACASL